MVFCYYKSQARKIMTSLISVIVTVFNLEDYVSKCIDSILNQDYKNLEIIIINDGSTDRTGLICDEYEKKYNNIIIVHKDNTGLSDSRNTGIKLAKGEYIAFVDADDYIETDLYSTLYNLIIENETDLSMVSYNFVRDEKKFPDADTGKITIFNQSEGLKELLVDKKVKNYVWNKLYKTEIVKNNLFPEYRSFEDIYFMHNIFCKIQSSVYYEKPKYNYIYRKNSLSNTVNSDFIKPLYKDIKNMYFNSIINYPDLEKYIHYNFSLWFIRLHLFTASSDIKIYFFDSTDYDILNEAYEKYGDYITDHLDDVKRVVLYSLLWNPVKSREYLTQLYDLAYK